MTSVPSDAPLLDVVALEKHFLLNKRLFGQSDALLRAVDGVDLRIRHGQSYGLVGESGSGKTTLVRCVLGLLPPSSGKVHFAGQEITGLRGEAQRRLRARMQIVFQDPYSSLNPRMNVARIVSEPLVIHRVGNRRSIHDRVQEVLDRVGLKPDHLHRYPHEFSGGQRQRIAIARALALEPTLLVLDELTSALDVSVQAQILNLLRDLQDALDLTYLIISHDLAVVRHMCDAISVMYRGRIVEAGGADVIFRNPIHPYTRALLASVPGLADGTIDAAAATKALEDERYETGPLIEMEVGHWVRGSTSVPLDTKA